MTSVSPPVTVGANREIFSTGLYKGRTVTDTDELEERVEKLEEENRKLREKLTGDKPPSSGNSPVSRRDFLKNIGLGVAGLGTISLIPNAASQVKITDQGITKDGNPLIPFSLGTNTLSSTLDVGSNNIEDNGKTIYDANEQHIPTSAIQQGSGSGLDADQLDGNQASSFATKNDLSNIDLTSNGNELYLSNSQPSGASPGDVWIDTST
jgi:hypothetical protein